MRVVSTKTLKAFRLGPCELCGRPGRCDPHHVYGRGFGSGTRLDVPENLVALCRVPCHLAAQEGHGMSVPEWRDALLRLVARREGTTPEAVTDYIHALRRLPRGSRLPACPRTLPPLPDAGGGLPEHQRDALPPGGAGEELAFG